MKRSSSPTLETLRAKRDEILALAERFGASNIRVFGSVARGEATDKSDVDLLVTYGEGLTLFDLAGFYNALNELLPYTVHITDDQTIKPRLKPYILRDSVEL